MRGTTVEGMEKLCEDLERFALEVQDAGIAIHSASELQKTAAALRYELGQEEVDD